jgi:hypothetical protein
VEDFLMNVNEFYDLNHSIQSFAVANDFVVNTNKACYALGQQLKPFCLYANDTQKEYGVIDFATFAGFFDPNTTLIDEIVNYRHDVFKDWGINININDELKKKLLFYDYLMTISICYIEVPKYVTKMGVATPTYDKFLATKNPAIMATWMGCEANEMQAKYSPKIKATQIEFDDNNIRCVKLNHTSKGNSITVPRTAYNIEKMSCIPMYMLYAFIEGFKPLIENGIVKFSYLKDNGTVRELATTLNEDIIREYYNDNIFINTMLSGIDINSVQQGGMSISSKMNRGYIKVPELGASVYDASGVRSLNVARLLQAEVVDSVDRSFINVDLDSVITNFCDCCDYLVKNNNSDLYNMYKELTKNDYDESKTTSLVVCNGACQEYARNRSTWLSTSYHRDLHLFMVSHPEWFPLYTGKPAVKVVSSANTGVLPMDF